MEDKTDNIKIIKPQEGFQEQFTRSNVDVVIGGGVLNCGKAQPLDSHVLTPNGFVRMGDLKVGDVVCGSNGNVQRVLNIFERGKLDTYKITFDDGTTVECCPEHLWTVYDNKELKRVTIEAQDIAKEQGRYTLPLCEGMCATEEFKQSLSTEDYIRACGFKVSKKDGCISILKDEKRFISFESIGKKEMRCIVVSNDDHLYITDGFNLTHNSFAAILSVAEPSKDPNFRACFIRRTFTELRSGGSLTDDFTVAYGDYINKKMTDPPRVSFPEGSFIDFRQINDESIAKVTETWKGAQYDYIYLDELTSFQFSTFKYLLSRNRGKAKWSGKFRGTTNPEKDCWVRVFIDWYIGADGQIREDRNGVVRYFYLQGERVEDVIWGDSKEEVYSKCRTDIDKKIKSLGGGFTYKNLIKSFTFYLGRMSENKASIGNNMDYAGSVAAVGGRQAQQLIEGNWNVSLKSDDDAVLPYNVADSVFNNDPRKNNDKWITADLADTGDDNTVILVWDGLHIIDCQILCTSTPKMNAEFILRKANQYRIPDNRIIYDGVRAVYINDYIPEAIAYISYRTSRGLYWRSYMYLKDECYARMCEMIKREMLSFSDVIAKSIYTHKNIKNPITVREEFIEECLVVRFKQTHSGKKTLLNKKEMNSMLGKNRSMDLLDPIAMRMLPLLSYEYGQELIATEQAQIEEENSYVNGKSIYDNSVWC